MWSETALVVFVEEPSGDQRRDGGGSLLVGNTKLERHVAYQRQISPILGCDAHQVEPRPAQPWPQPLEFGIVDSLVVCAPPPAHAILSGGQANGGSA